jgi:hypothetical protein
MLLPSMISLSASAVSESDDRLIAMMRRATASIRRF